MALFFISGCKNSSQPALTIAVASNSMYVMQEIADAFRAKYGLEVELISGSSGKLTYQIIEGAPYDIFVSADAYYPNKVYREGLADDAPTIYAYGQLILWSSKIKVTNQTLFDLAKNEEGKLAIANPNVAPYGKAAKYYLDSLGLLDELEEVMVYGESVAQVNQFVDQGAVSAGITAKSVVYSEMFTGGSWIELPHHAKLLPQAIVPLATIKDEEIQNKFVAFVTSAEGQRILQKYGYTTPL